MELIIKQDKQGGWNVWVALQQTNQPEDESETFIIGTGLTRPEALRHALIALNEGVDNLKAEVAQHALDRSVS